MSPGSELADFIAGHPRLAVLSGAGCSTGSGIPDYRDEHGEWKHAKPVQIADFIGSVAVRRRYWARSFVGWSRISAARPNTAHYALARLEHAGFVERLITQNVDNLHRRAGSRRVIDLHGALHTVICLGCDRSLSREDLQNELERRNRGWKVEVERYAPDGDAAIGADAAPGFEVPDCEHCGGVLKPDVVFFGENVPRERVAECSACVENADALLVVGSSLMVFSGFRFARQANAAGKPIVIVNIGRTRADELADGRFAGDCGELLSDAADRLAA